MTYNSIIDVTNLQWPAYTVVYPAYMARSLLMLGGNRSLFAPTCKATRQLPACIREVSRDRRALVK